MSFLKRVLINKSRSVMQSFGVTRAFGKAFDRLCVSAAIIIRQFMACACFFGATFIGSQHVGFCMKKLRIQP